MTYINQSGMVITQQKANTMSKELPKNVYYMGRDKDGNFVPRANGDTRKKAWESVIMLDRNSLYSGDYDKFKKLKVKEGYRVDCVRVIKHTLKAK